MSALLFPGQGSQISWYGIQNFIINFELVKKIFNQADEKLNIPLSKLILRRSKNELHIN